MKYIVHNLKIEIDGNGSILPTLAARKMGCGVENIRSLVIARRSLDARPDHIGWIYSVVVDVKSKGKYQFRSRHRRESVDVRPWKPVEAPQYSPGELSCNDGPVIIGSGPAGMFAALVLAEAGYMPLVLERGPDVETRGQRIESLIKDRSFDTEANFLFGEGGAGTYSDGKLYSRKGDALGQWLISRLVDFGADPDIAIDGRPHIGSDRLGYICQRIRQHIESRGGRYMFDTRVDGFDIEDGSLKSLRLAKGEILETRCAILAVGHSARDTFAALARDGVKLEAKAFQMGLRIEHPQAYINQVQLGPWSNRRELVPADYHIVARGAASDGDVYSFCMCPGGAVLPSHSQAGTICSNGGSKSERDSGFANAALVMSVSPDQYGASEDNPLAGLDFQREIEEKCFKAAGSDYSMAAQLVEDFMANRRGVELPENSSLTGSVPVNFHDLLPDFICDALVKALKQFDDRLDGFASDPAILLGPETRASCPVRIPRDREKRTSLTVENLYPAGEGAGYAGGILSSAIDGVKAAGEIISNYARPQSVKKA